MPLGKVFDAREGQVLPSPVRSYYQGKAVRAGVAAQEKETEQADEKLDLERRKVAAAEAGVGLRKLENDLATAEGQREMVLHAAAASMQAYESNPDLPEGEKRAKAWDASVAVLDHYMPGGRDAVLATFQERGEPTGAAGFDPEETIALLTDPDQFFEGRESSPSQQTKFIGDDGNAHVGSYDTTTGLYTDSSGIVHKGASPIAPQATQADLGFGGGAGDKTSDRKTREVIGGAENLLSSVDRIAEQIDKMPQSAMGLPGAAASLVDNTVSAVIGFAELFPGATAQIGTQTVNESALLDVRLYKDSFSGPAADNAALQANAIGLAYALARAANPDGRISDADVRHQLERVKLDKSSKTQIQAALRETKREILINVANHLRVGGYTKNEEGKAAYDKFMTQLDEMNENNDAGTDNIDAMEEKYPGFGGLSPEQQQMIRDAE